jgi:hypothetical protein
MVARAGAGPNSIPHKQLTVEKLVNAINFCMKPESLDRARELASTIATERGSDMGAQSFHQYLEPDRLRCTLAPSRAAVWRIKRTNIRLSAFAACTLANADLLDFQDLKLFRPQEYCTDEGPRDPISGGFTTACRAFYSMGLGIAEVPSETWKAMQMPFGSSRQRSQASVQTITKATQKSGIGEGPVLSMSPKQSQTNLGVRESLAHVRSPPSLSGNSSRTSSIRSSTLQGQMTPKQDDVSQHRLRRYDSSSSDKPDMLRQSSAHTSKGAGRAVTALVNSPMELSVAMTKGLHNVPRLWGDDTVRPQERIHDFKSGMQAVGKEFGYGWYDGVTGLVTQPWNGAKRDGAAGFLKGIGKGMGGFVAKGLAANMGVLGYTMKGVHKEVQKLFGSNVQNCIATSRVAQGYEEWLESTDQEKQDVIDGWTTIQKYMKKKANPERLMQDVLDEHRSKTMENRRAASASQSPNSADAPNQDHAAAVNTTTMEHSGGADLPRD